MLLLKRGGAGLLALLGLHSVQADELAVGSPAPKFTLMDQESKTHALAEYRGRWVVLYFYPKDDTPGCTTEAHNFQRDLKRYEERNAVILGVSTTSSRSHKDFCAKEGLAFHLLAYTDRKVSTA